MATEKQIKASNKFNKQGTKCILLRLNLRTDTDIIQKLNSVSSKMGYIKKLIRKNIGDENA